MTSQPGKRVITIHTFANISRNKGNQTMKHGQLTHYKKKNIFLEKSFAKCVGKTIPRLSSIKSKLRYLCLNSLKFYTVCFYCMPSLGLSK